MCLDIDIDIGSSGESHRAYKRGAIIQSAGWSGLPGRVLEGAICLTQPNNRDGTMVLALPGDLIGVEALVGQRLTLEARAVVTTTIDWLGPVRTDGWRTMLVEALLIRQEHQAQFALLRQGPIPQRIRHLLRLLSGELPMRARAGKADEAAEADGMLARCELPSLQDMALIVDTAPETVSRIISALRRNGRLQVLRGRQAVLMPALSDTGLELPAGMTRSRISDLPARCAA
jgi:CRP-like cAMP-binding protein